MNITITGSSGFVGINLLKYLKQYPILVNTINTRSFSSATWCLIENVYAVVHLAGKAHDLQNDSNSDEYYKINTELTKKIFDAFILSNAKVFIIISSVKAVADEMEGLLTEKTAPNPKTHYGKSKLLAEQYIQAQSLSEGKRVYILRPCMIHGPGNKGNLNQLYKLVSQGIFWPLGQFENKRSYLSIENLCFIIKELLERSDIPSGVYNVSDDISLSTNDLVQLIAESNGKKVRFINFNKSFIIGLSYFGDILKLPLNSERLKKLTGNYIVSNKKIISAIGKPLPVSSKDGLLKTFYSFSSNA